MATATKASLQSELLAAQAELYALREQHESLQSKLEGAELIQTLWLCDLLEGQGERSNPATGTRSFRFAAQKSRRDKRTGKYNRGPKRTFVAYGPIVDQLAEIYASDDRRVAITAFESPWSDGSGRSDWTVTSVQVQQRPEPAPATTHQEVVDPELF